MRQIWIPRYGRPEVLELREAPTPEPGRGELRIKVRASGVNFADLMARMGVYPDGPPPPCVVGYEVSGVVDAVGSGVSSEYMGARVVAVTPFGGYSSHVVVPAQGGCARIPDGVSFEVAAALPVAGLTCWMILEEMHRIRPGDRVLVHSAGGAVGLMAGQFIKHRQGVAIGTASKQKHEFLREWGYDYLIDYQEEDYEVILREQAPLDLVMDPLGGRHWSKGLRLLRSGGKIACYGMSVNAEGKTVRRFQIIRNIFQIPFWGLGPLGLINQNKGVFGINMGRLWDEKERLTTWIHQILRWVADGDIRVQVHATLPFERAAEAHQIVHDRKNIGKVILIPEASREAT